MKLIITRHGETDKNVKGLSSGQDNAKLTARGISQAKYLGRRLALENISTIYASDLDRSIKTIGEFSGFPQKNIVFLSEARERSYGELEGANRQVFFGALRKSGNSPADFRPRGGESLNDLSVRTRDFAEKYINPVMDGKTTLCIVAHRAFNLSLLMHYLDPSDCEIEQDNCCINEIEFDCNAGVINFNLNCTKHLFVIPPFSKI